MRAGWYSRLCNNDSRIAAVLLAYTINAVGSGLWLTGGTIFLLRDRSLTGSQVGIGLAAGGVIGVAFGVLAGNLADRLGSRRVVLGALGIEGAAMLAYLGVTDLVGLITVTAFAAAGLSATNAARGALLVELFGVAEATRTRSLVRAGSNLGIAVGGLAAGVLLAISTPTAFRALIVSDAATFVVAALLLMRLPAVRVVHRDHQHDPWRGLKDAQYVRLTAVNGVMTMHYGVLSVGIPLWVHARGTVPDFILAVLMILNTVICVLFQVHAGRGMEHPRRAGAAIARSGLLFLAACSLIAFSGWTRGTATVAALLIAATLALSVGELLQAGGSFGASYAFAPEGHHGQYQGVWNVGYSLGESVSPFAMSAAVAAGTVGWISLGALFLLSGFIFRMMAVDVGEAPQSGAT